VTINRGDRGARVYLKFTTRTRLVVPKGRLRPGTKYTWRVFSYVGKNLQPSSSVMTSCFTTRR